MQSDRHKIPYPRLKREQFRHAKLSSTDTKQIVRLYKGGASRYKLAEDFGVSYHTIYLLTAPALTLERYKERQRARAKAIWQTAKKNPKLRSKLQAFQRASRAHRRKVNPNYREYERKEWLARNPINS